MDPTRTSAPSVAASDASTASPGTSPGASSGASSASPGASPGGPSDTARPYHQRYEILGEHARGGLGRVSRARDHELGRDIAIKELISRGNVSEIRFFREALITARLEHPGIVPVYEAGRWRDGTPFYAMKLVAGRPLRALIAERATVDERIGLLHHVIAVADAIAYAHGRNIIHRDLKPSNVIVGDFGETIVIDWGLAKDLSAADDVAGDGGARSPSDDDLTSTGSVLGTPAYMAPEQHRGEPVDQRADVFAIGAMLWELCTAQKLPPGPARQRSGILRRAGIDPDLTSIIIKAIAPDAAHRYSDAGALAVDLKAFKAGARITAREYSLPATLAHWTRRHRALALSVGLAIAVTAAGIASYVTRIAAERERVAAAADALILQQAELLLHSDPTAALELLGGYHGAETARHAMLRAQALGLGVARFHVKPHSHAIRAARSTADGTLFTISIDGSLVKTSPDGTVRVIARDAAPAFALGYSDARSWLAYPCEATAICLLDARTEQRRPPPTEVSAEPLMGIAWAPGGRLLAALSEGGDLAVWQIFDDQPPVLRHRTTIERGVALGFVDDHTLVATSQSGVAVFHLDTSPFLQLGPGSRFALDSPGELSWDGPRHLVAVSTGTGELVAIDSATNQLLSRTTLCKGPLSPVVMPAGRTAVGYACRSGDAGVWDLERASATVVMHLDGGAWLVAASADGRYLLAGGGNGALAIYDSLYGMISSYLGHSARLTALAPPSPGHPWIASSDVNGELRVWPVPDPAARVIITSSSPIYRATLLRNGIAVAIDDSRVLHWYAPDGTAGEAPGHRPLHYRIAVSSTESRFVAFGPDRELEIWSFDGPPTVRRDYRIYDATDVAYAPDGTWFLVGCADGTLVGFGSAGEWRREYGSVGEPIWYLRWLRGIDGVVIGGKRGTLWTADQRGLRYLGHEPGLINSVAASPDARWLVTATSEGVLRRYDIATRLVSTYRSPHPSSQFLIFSPDSTTLAVVTDKTISLIATPPTGAAAPAAPPWTWNQVDAAVGHCVFSPDSMWFAAVGERGGIWFNRRGDRRWVYLATGTARVSFGYFSDDGNRFIATEPSGRVLLVDMRAAIFR